MRKILVVFLLSALMIVFGCSKEGQAPTGDMGNMGAPGGEAMPPPVFVPNAGANWKAAKIEVAAKDGSDAKTMELAFEDSEQTKVTVAGVTISLKAVQMVPDFVMSGSNNIGSRSTELNNPAVQLIITEEGKEPVKQWLFEKLPSVHAFEHEKITIAATGFIEKSAADKQAPATTETETSGGKSPH